MPQKSRSNEFISNIKYAAKELDQEEQSLRVLAQQGKLTFITAIRNSKDSGWLYYTDVQLLEKVKAGEAPKFRA